MRTLARCTVLVALSPLAAGCGNDRADTKGLLDVPPRAGEQTLRYRDAGLTVVLPRAFKVSRASSPQLFRASLEEAFVSAFAYRRKERLPKTRDELRTARDRLVRVAKGRDKTFRLRQSRLTRVAGAPAIELIGDQTIFRGKLRLRSLHAYKGNGEYVIEVVAPRPAFRRLDRAVFPGLRRTLKLTGKVKKAAPKRQAKKERKRATRKRGGEPERSG